MTYGKGQRKTDRLRNRDSYRERKKRQRRDQESHGSIQPNRDAEKNSSKQQISPFRLTQSQQSQRRQEKTWTGKPRKHPPEKNEFQRKIPKMLEVRIRS